MDLNRFSLMTFRMDPDVEKGKITVLDTFLIAKESGIPFVDVLNVNNQQIPMYQNAVAKTGVKVYAYIEVISFLDPEEKWIGPLCKAAEKAKNLDAKYLMIVPYGFYDVYRAQTMGKEMVFQYMVSGFRKAVEVGKASGIRICVETTPHAESCLSSTADCMRILDAVNDLDLVFDTANMLPCGEDPLEAYALLKNRISHVHLKDVVIRYDTDVPPYSEHTADGGMMECTVWGDGIIPIKRLYEAMLADGYSALFAIEYARPQEDLCSTEQHIAQIDKFAQYLLA